ncbi:ester cyclase [Hymenobacter terrenus]|uniref:ester cyclase n=1 Tax=Hymenobacter terrenus TaxID=1629124 RepID=UPI000619248A|nr:ester cyclase [Hymenobacter terrenus]
MDIPKIFFADLYNANDPERAASLAESLAADDFVDHSPAFGATPDKAGFVQTVAYINATFTQQYVVEQYMQQGTMHVGIWRSVVRHTGPFMGMAPTGRAFDVQGITVYQIEDGKVKAHWEQFDVVGILQNIGIININV